MSTLEELLAQRSSESRKRIAARADEIRLQNTLARIREELDLSQTQVAEAMGIKQPAIVKMERVENDPRLSTLKRYIAALGGELSLDVMLPDGKRIALQL